MRKTPIEVLTRFGTTVETLTDAFEFVMEHLELTGEAPSIEISPFWTYSAEESGTLGFSVVVSGTQEQEEKES